LAAYAFFKDEGLPFLGIAWMEGKRKIWTSQADECHTTNTFF
jgi:hypothetical protein